MSAVTLCDQVACDPGRAVPNRPQIIQPLDVQIARAVTPGLPADAPPLRRQRPQRPRPPHLRPHHDRHLTTPAATTPALALGGASPTCRGAPAPWEIKRGREPGQSTAGRPRELSRESAPQGWGVPRL